jgi:hypothetical protein
MGDFEIRYPQLGDRLAEEHGDKVLFADWLSGRWYHYADAYKEGADKLVDQIDEMLPDDRVILPIIFLYRHFVELKLKWIIIYLDMFGGTQMPQGSFRTHDLFQLWAYARNHLVCLRSTATADEKITDATAALIKELSDLDPGSMHFRYPHDNEMKEFLLPRCLGMKQFKDAMAILANGLLYIESGIDIERDGRALDARLEAEWRRYAEDY